MSLVISDTKSSTLEPLKKNRWFLQFTSIPGQTQTESDMLAFCCHTGNRPTIDISEEKSDRLNEQFYIAGKPTWSGLDFGFYDYIQGPKSATNILYEWSKKVYNPITGQMGFKTDYTTSAVIAMLDPMGGIVQVWNLFYCWPQKISWDNMDAGDTALSNVTLTLKYDYAIKPQDINTSGM